MQTLTTRIAAALLACAAMGAHAAPLVYTGSQFAADSVAVAGAVASVDSKTSPPETLPLISTATAVSDTNFASALGFAGSGLLPEPTTLALLLLSAGLLALVTGSKRVQGR